MNLDGVYSFKRVMGDDEKTICNGNDCIECNDKCVYRREGEDYEALEYCFHRSREYAHIAITDEECPAVSANHQISVNILYSENGDFVEQRDSYDQEYDEAEIFVPAHGNLSAIDMIISPSKMVFSEPYHCQVAHRMKNISVYNMPLKATEIAAKANSSVFTESDEQVVYSINLDEGELSEDEKDELSENIMNKCKGKKIFKMSVKYVDEDTFSGLSNEEVFEIEPRQTTLSSCPTMIKVDKLPLTANFSFKTILSSFRLSAVIEVIEDVGDGLMVILVFTVCKRILFVLTAVMDMKQPTYAIANRFHQRMI